MLPRTVTVLLTVSCVALLVAAAASARPQAAALDRALRAGGFYAGSPSAAEPTVIARRSGALLGARPLRRGESGWDVAELEFALAWQGFPSGTIDGRFGPKLASALTRFQRAVRLHAGGIAGAATINALRRPPPGAAIPLVWPVLAPLGDGYGPRATASTQASTYSHPPAPRY
jgi:peptidoglycan hydrolase-like protein with peptidoglycan-binding domain